MTTHITKEGLTIGDWTVNYDGKFQIEYRDNLSGDESAFRVTRGFAVLIMESLARAGELSAQESKPVDPLTFTVKELNGFADDCAQVGMHGPKMALYQFAAVVSAQDASPKDGPEPQQILVLNEQGVHAAIERTEDGKWKFSTYPDGSLFIRFPSPKDGWQPIATAPKDRQIIGVAPYGSRWSAHHLWFDTQVEEWTDIHSDQYFSPTQYMPLPETTK